MEIWGERKNNKYCIRNTAKELTNGMIVVFVKVIWSIQESLYLWIFTGILQLTLFNWNFHLWPLSGLGWVIAGRCSVSMGTRHTEENSPELPNCDARRLLRQTRQSCTSTPLSLSLSFCTIHPGHWLTYIFSVCIIPLSSPLSHFLE